MSFARTFLLRAAGVVLIASAVGVFFLRESWGDGAIPSLTWAGLWACILGVIGFRGLSRLMACEPGKILGTLVSGMVLRILVLAGSQSVVFLAYGGEWGRRTLIATVLLYLLVLGVEIFTLNQLLRVGALRSQSGALAEKTSDKSTEGNSGE